jgi:hypothetical protein
MLMLKQDVILESNRCPVAAEHHNRNSAHAKEKRWREGPRSSEQCHV